MMMHKVKLPISAKSFDPDKGLLCVTTYWRPHRSDPDPEMPGEKVSAMSFMAVGSHDICLCGSGELFGDCCQAKTYWQVVTPNPGLHQGFEGLAPQSATFTGVDGHTLGPALMDDERLYCTENTIARAFWSYWGDPSLLAPLGTMNFGDFELINAQTLIVTALSNTRMQTLLVLLHEITGDSLGEPRMEFDPVDLVEKPRRATRRHQPKSRKTR